MRFLTPQVSALRLWAKQKEVICCNKILWKDDSVVNADTKYRVASGFSSWCVQCNQKLREKSIIANKDALFLLIGDIATKPVDVDPKRQENGKNYEGEQYWLNSIVAAIGNARSMDTTCKVACELAPISYALSKKFQILES